MELRKCTIFHAIFCGDFRPVHPWVVETVSVFLPFFIGFDVLLTQKFGETSVPAIFNGRITTEHGMLPILKHPEKTGR